MSDAPKNVYVVVRCDWEEQWPYAVYAKKSEAKRCAKDLDAEHPPNTSGFPRYAHRVERVAFHA